MKPRRPFMMQRTERGVGDDYACVWDASGQIVAVGASDMCERRVYGWNGLVEPTMERLLADIDDMTSPTNMSPDQAKEFLDRLSCEIETRLDGLKDDLRDRASRD